MNRAWVNRVDVKRFAPYKGELSIVYQITGKIDTNVDVRGDKEGLVTSKILFTYSAGKDPFAVCEVEGHIHIDNFPGEGKLVKGATLDKQPREFVDLIEHMVLDEVFLPVVPAVRAARLPTPLPTFILTPPEGTTPETAGKTPA